MQQCNRIIKQYKQRVSDLQVQFDQKYFDTTKLLKQISQHQGEICSLLNSIQQNRQYLLLAETISSKKISSHPLRIPKNVAVQEQQPLFEQQIRNNFYKHIITQNSRIQLKIFPIKIHPFFKSTPGKRSPQKTIDEKQNFKLILYHTDKVSQLGPFKYTDCTNIIKSYSHSYNKNWNKKNKLGVFEINYEVTLSNFQSFKEIFNKQNKLYIFLQNQFGLMVAVCQIEFFQLFTHLTYIDLQDGFSQTFPKLLKFKHISTTDEQFTLECLIKFNKKLISPQIFQLNQTSHPQRKIISQANRSRSPSPTLHKQAARSLVKNAIRATTRRISIFDNRLVKILLYQREDRYEQTKNYTIGEKENILQIKVEILEEKVGIYVSLFAKLQNQTKQGFYEVQISKIKFKITVKKNKVLQFLTIGQYKNLYKGLQNYKNHNVILMLTPNVYIRPSSTVSIVQYPIQHKITKHQICSYFFKGSTNSENFYISPGRIRQITKGQKGVTLFFTLVSGHLDNIKELKIVFASKTASNTENSSSSINELGKYQHLNNSNKFTQKYHQDHIELHIVKYIINEAKPQLNLSIDVKKPGIYSLDMRGVLHKNSKFYLQSCNQVLVQVVRQKFDEETTQNGVQIQLLKPIKIQAYITLILHDLSRHMTTLINLQLNEIQYWKNT